MKEKLGILFVGVFVILVIGMAVFGIAKVSDSSSLKQSTSSKTATTSVSTNTESSTTNSGGTSVTASQLASHNTTADCWIAINGGVYDVSAYDHPKVNPFDCGADNSDGWNSERKHSDSLLSLVTYIGKLN